MIYNIVIALIIFKIINFIAVYLLNKFKTQLSNLRIRNKFIKRIVNEIINNL